MGLDAWAVRLAKHRRGVALLGLIVAFTGVSMVLNPTHAADLVWLGLPVLAAGFALFAWVVWPSTDDGRPLHTLGARFLNWISWNGRLVLLFPVAGVVLLAADLTYNLLLSLSPALLTEDVLVLATAGTLIAYGLVPARYSRERDFVLLFFVVLDALLVAPLLLARAILGTADASVDVYSWTALAPELSVILSVLGIANSVHSVPGYTAPGLSFTPLQMSQAVTLVISTSCSGIYSFGIFASAYVAFLLTEYGRPSRRLWALLVLGFLASYVANLLRMTVIVLVGYYTDSAQTDLQNLLLAHSYAGWIIFLAWLALFWGALLKILPLESDESPRPDQPVPETRVPKGLCGRCQTALSLAIPAIRCTCGAIYHRGCLAAEWRCWSCHRKVALAVNALGEETRDKGIASQAGK